MSIFMLVQSFNVEVNNASAKIQKNNIGHKFFLCNYYNPFRNNYF